MRKTFIDPNTPPPEPIEWLRVTMPDKTLWNVSVATIAHSHASYYAKLDGVPYERALEETLDLFKNDTYEIIDWAENNMNWEDVKKHAWKSHTPPETVDYQDGWVNGKKEIVKEVRNEQT
jgi:hypothetical protein